MVLQAEMQEETTRACACGTPFVSCYGSFLQEQHAWPEEVCAVVLWTLCRRAPLLVHTKIVLWRSWEVVGLDVPANLQSQWYHRVAQWRNLNQTIPWA